MVCCMVCQLVCYYHALKETSSQPYLMQMHMIRVPCMYPNFFCMGIPANVVSVPVASSLVIVTHIAIN